MNERDAIKAGFGMDRNAGMNDIAGSKSMDCFRLAKESYGVVARRMIVS